MSDRNELRSASEDSPMLSGMDGKAGKQPGLTRREMLTQALMAGVLLPQRLGNRGGRGGMRSRVIDPAQIPAYKYRTLPVSRFAELQAEYDKYKNDSGISRNKAFRDEVTPLNFKVPADFSNAKSVVVMATFAKLMYVNFHLDGKTIRVMVPPQYYADDMNAEKLKSIIQKDIVKRADSRVVDISNRVPLKPLAAHSGLGRYGRNNLIFVEGMGTFNLLAAFLTDQTFPEDNWTAINILDACRRCDHCDRICPTGSISRSNFLLNIDRCITLYNENPGDFPNWIMKSSHHALMGCVRCQDPCPENSGFSSVTGNLEDISEEETQKILNGISDDTLLKALQRKLKDFPAAESKATFPVLTRNLNVLARP
jgi:epoxyqueuosine reductase